MFANSYKDGQSLFSLEFFKVKSSLKAKEQKKKRKKKEKKRQEDFLQEICILGMFLVAGSK